MLKLYFLGYSGQNIYIYFLIFIYLALLGLSCGTGELQWQHVGSLVAACELLIAACGIQFPDQGLNLGPLHWELRVVTTGPLGKSQNMLLKLIFPVTIQFFFKTQLLENLTSHIRFTLYSGFSAALEVVEVSLSSVNSVKATQYLQEISSSNLQIPVRNLVSVK